MCRHLFVLSFLGFVSYNSTKDCIFGSRVERPIAKGQIRAKPTIIENFAVRCKVEKIAGILRQGNAKLQAIMSVLPSAAVVVTQIYRGAKGLCQCW